jgi:hypothetical protein
MQKRGIAVEVPGFGKRVIDTVILDYTPGLPSVFC